MLRNKTDGADAKGLLEVLRNDSVCAVPVKSVDQHVLTELHRLRSAWMATRTARLNTLRGLLRELGFTIPVGARQVVFHVIALVSEADSGLPDALRAVVPETTREIRNPGRTIYWGTVRKTWSQYAVSQRYGGALSPQGVSRTAASGIGRGPFPSHSSGNQRVVPAA